MHFVQDFFIRAQDWITFSDPIRPTRGLTNKEVLARFAHLSFLFVCSGKQACLASK